MDLRRVVAMLAVLALAEAGGKLVVVMIDGVRWDYLDDPQLKGFKRIAETGVKSTRVEPIYPSTTYPNSQTLFTGLYPENHGFVENYMYDNDTDSFFYMIPDKGAYNPIWWNDAEPLFITAEKNNMAAALYWWAGCEVETFETHPTICERQRYGAATPEEKNDFLLRIDDIVSLFRPSKRFNSDRLSLAIFYYGSVDYAGHHYGPTSLETKHALLDIDDILDKMQDKFKAAGLEDEVNIMVVSDHGMTDAASFKTVDLEPFAVDIKYQLEHGASTMLIPKDGKLDKLYDALVSSKLEGVQVFKKEDIPEGLHLKHSRRTMPVFLKAKPGYIIRMLKNTSKTGGVTDYMSTGNHGWDPDELEDMKTVFLATGPAFRTGFEAKSLNNVDLYNVMCSVLNLKPLPNNGTWSRVQSMLHNGNMPDSGQPSSHTSDSGVSANVHGHYHYVVSVFVVSILLLSGKHLL